MDLINKNNCKKVLFAGKIDKPKISNLRLDVKGIYYLPRIVKAAKLGDAAILRELIKILGENKIKVIKSNFYNPELTLSKGNYTKIKPTKLNLIDIKIGIDNLKKINAYNHVQGLIVRNKKDYFKRNIKRYKKNDTICKERQI